MEFIKRRLRGWYSTTKKQSARDASAEAAASSSGKAGAVVKFGEGIAAKFAVIFSLLVLIATGTVGFMVYRGAEQSLIDTSTDRLKHTAEVIEVRLSANIEAISKDLHFLAATPPVQGTVRAHLEGARNDSTYIDPETFIDDQEWLDQLANTFTVFLENRPSYMQASFVVLAQDGRELVRVERHDQQAYRISDSKLNAEEEDFFQKAADLPPGAFYLSDMTLSNAETARQADGEDDVVAKVPTARAITPVYASSGRVYGFITIQVDARSMLDTFESLVDSKYSMYLANEEGEFLNPPDASGAFRDTFPQATSWFNSSSNNRLVKRLDDEERTAKIAYFERIQFGQGPGRRHLLVGITSPYETILSRAKRVRTRSLYITLLFGLAGIVFALGFSGYLTHPLRQITRALSRFGRDRHMTERPVHLPVRRQDEIGMLARTFDAMTRQIRQQMRELADKEHRQRIILETSAEGIIVVTDEGTVETSNQTVEQLFGYGEGELEGRSIEQLLPTPNDADGNDEDRTWLPPWKQIGSGREVTGRRKDGTTIPLSLAVSAFELSGEQKYAIFLQDISERKRYERVLQQAKEKAEEVARLKSTFLANMSHEIRTPLTTVIGYAGVLANEVSDKHREFAEFIQRSGERLMDTLNSVLSLAQLEANGVEIQLDVLEVTEEAREIVQLFQPLAQEKKLNLHFEPPAGGEAVYARLDSGALSSILQNLVGNALKFTEEGGVAVQVKADEDEVYLRVHDTGIGMDPDFLPRLFDEFVQESTGVGRSHEGSGLGLAITKRLVGLMDGRITVESEKGEGTVFTVAFPRVAAPATRNGSTSSKTGATLASTRYSQMNVLLVEDNQDTASLMQDILRERYDVTPASNAEEALRTAQEGTYDLILLDINLGGGASGVDVLRQLRAQPAYRQVPIAAVTAYALPGDRERFLQMGFDAYLSKPFTPEDLDQLVDELLEPA